MASPEYPLQPPELAVPDSDEGGGLDVQTGTSDLHSAVSTSTETSQSFRPAEGSSQLAPIPDVPSVVDPGSASLQNSWAKLRKTRRQLWEETGEVPPASGGSPARKDLPLDIIRQLYYEGWPKKEIARELNVSTSTIRRRVAEIGQYGPTREEAKAVIEAFFVGPWERPYDRKVAKRKINQVIRLNDLYPGLREEVYRELQQRELYPHQTDLSQSESDSSPEGRELTLGEYLSKDAFWVFDYLYTIGYTKHLRELAHMEGIDFEAGLEELRRLNILEESDPAYPKVTWPKF